MASSEPLEILKAGVSAWNRWREENLDARPDLSSINLGRQDLREVDFSRCFLAETHLNNADLSSANLRRANL
jgi:uncharacterized protein YjbI with pentapeptide repeats